jgi:hypothetical protein
MQSGVATRWPPVSSAHAPRSGAPGRLTSALSIPSRCRCSTGTALPATHPPALLSQPSTARSRRTPKYLPLPQPTSATTLPGCSDSRNARTFGHTAKRVDEKCDAMASYTCDVCEEGRRAMSSGRGAQGKGQPELSKHLHAHAPDARARLPPVPHGLLLLLLSAVLPHRLLLCWCCCCRCCCCYCLQPCWLHARCRQQGAAAAPAAHTGLTAAAAAAAAALPREAAAARHPGCHSTLGSCTCRGSHAPVARGSGSSISGCELVAAGPSTSL